MALPDVVALADDLLNEVTDALSDPPERAYVNHGDPPAWDCEQLTVTLTKLRPRILSDRGAGDTNPINCALVWVAGFVVVLLRCVPGPKDNGDPPEVDDLSDAYRDLLGQGVDMARHLSRQWSTGAWPDGLPCGHVTWAPLEPLPPAGGFAGWRLPVEVQL